MMMKTVQARVANKSFGCKPEGKRNVRKSRRVCLEDVEKYFTELKTNHCHRVKPHLQLK
jgi:hypothetical protein